MRKFIVFALCFVFVFTAVHKVSAYSLLGGKHKTNNIKYNFVGFEGTYDKIGKPFNDAILDWNATNTKINFAWSSSGYQITVKAKDFGNVSWSGRCTNYRQYITFGDYVDSVIEGNLYYLNRSTYSANKVKGVWAHELGHALGLDHVSGSNKLMYDNDGRTVYKPTTDEVNGVNALYK
ncbi:matrixin family metalloprotease [Sutcliffiella cohnii]